MRPALSQIPIHIALVVWGDVYADLFVELGLPSQLSPRNIPLLGEQATIRYRIFTTASDAEQIRRCSAFASLQGVENLEVEFVTVDPDARNKYQFVSKCHVLASNDALNSGAYVAFLDPDGVYADGSLGRLATYAHAKWQAVMTLGLRTSLEHAVPELRREFGVGTPLTIAPRRAVEIALRNLHPINRGMFWDAEQVSTWPAHVNFRIDENAFIAHCWHLHPILVKPARLADNKVGTIDGGRYLSEIVADPAERTLVVSDSDEFFFLEFTPIERRIAASRPGPLGVKAIADWAKFHTTAFNRMLFAVPVVVHARPLDGSSEESVAASKNFARQTVVEPTLAQSTPTWKERTLFALVRLRAQVRLRTRAIGIAKRAFRFTAAVLIGFAARLTGVFARCPGRLRSLICSLHQQMGHAIATSFPGYWRAALPGMAMQVGMEALDHGDLETSYFAVALARQIKPDDENVFYELLIRTLRELKGRAEHTAHALRQTAGSKQRHVFSAVIWGNDYIDNFMKYMVRSLLARGNLPALQDGEVYMSIITTPSGAHRIRSKKSFVELQRYSSVHFFEFPEALTEPFHYSRPTFNFYRLYGALDHTSIHFARAFEANIFFIVVDGVCSWNTISNLKKFLDQGYDICANASIVSNRETFLPALDERFPENEPIEIRARDLANLGLAHRHAYISQRLVIRENRNFDKYPRELYFPTDAGLVVHALYQHPLVISQRAICKNVEFDYFIVDSKLMARIFDDSAEFARLKVVTDSDDVYVANFAPRERKFETTGRPLNADDFVSVHLHSAPIHHYIWGHRQLIRCDTDLRTYVDSSSIASEFLESLVAAQRKATT